MVDTRVEKRKQKIYIYLPLSLLKTSIYIRQAVSSINPTLYSPLKVGIIFLFTAQMDTTPSYFPVRESVIFPCALFLFLFLSFPSAVTHGNKRNNNNNGGDVHSPLSHLRRVSIVINATYWVGTRSNKGYIYDSCEVSSRSSSFSLSPYVYVCVCVRTLPTSHPQVCRIP